MHVAFFNRSFYPDMAATGQLLTELCESLAQDYGCRVSVVAGMPLLPETDGATQARSRGWLFHREVYRGVEIFRAHGTRWSNRSILGRTSNYLTYFISATVAGRYLDEPDVVIALTDPPIIGLSAHLAARHFNVPLMVSFRDIFPEINQTLKGVDSALVDRLLHEISCFLVRKSSRVIALGETMRQKLIAHKAADPGKTIVIPDWADCRAIRPRPKRNAFSQAHGLTHAFVVMHSGNMGLSQGLETLLEAAARLQSFSDIQFVLIGEGVKKQDLMAQAQHLGLRNVQFLPHQPKAMLPNSFATADVFIVSLQRGLAGYIVPSKLYGILAAGRPYVAAVEPACEVRAITRQYRCGLSVEPGDAQGLAEAITTLYQHRSLTQQLGRNARRAAIAFDRQQHVRAYYNLLCGDVTTPSLAA
ncbi:glycosyltransferase family 4 protein [Candidatus Entotheonella palauensis]|uniref:glycosyltransferase family 4 protein n=1 Tax=Candidatus Entotheonella palauensis TaxID=93172 RepID=UPI0015C49D91|nr:glycosyltransferase family 4 protein [Candidatus Entotheonella palauensis]